MHAPYPISGSISNTCFMEMWSIGLTRHGVIGRLCPDHAVRKRRLTLLGVRSVSARQWKYCIEKPCPWLSGTGVSRDVSSRKMVQAMPCHALATADSVSRCFLTMYFALKLPSSGGGWWENKLGLWLAATAAHWRRHRHLGIDSHRSQIAGMERTLLLCRHDCFGGVTFPSSSPSLAIERCRGLDIRHGDRRSPVYLRRADIKWTVPGKTIHP